MKLKKLRAGSYETPDRRFTVYSYVSESTPKTTWWSLWSLDREYQPDEFGGVFPTLTAARDWLELNYRIAKVKCCECNQYATEYATHSGGELHTCRKCGE